MTTTSTTTPDTKLKSSRRMDRLDPSENIALGEAIAAVHLGRGLPAASLDAALALITTLGLDYFMLSSVLDVFLDRSHLVDVRGLATAAGTRWLTQPAHGPACQEVIQACERHIAQWQPLPTPTLTEHEQTVLDELWDCSLNVTRLAARTGLSSHYAKKALTVLIKHGLVACDYGRGRSGCCYRALSAEQRRERLAEQIADTATESLIDDLNKRFGTQVEKGRRDSVCLSTLELRIILGALRGEHTL